MSLAALKKVVPPPKLPDVVDFDARWKEFEKTHKRKLPRDYRDLVRTYGDGLLAGFYLLYSPLAESPWLNLAAVQERETQDLLQLRGSSPDRCPFPIYPEPGGLYPWGGDENGNTYFWLTSGPTNTWPVVQYEPRGTGFLRHDCSVTAFLTGVWKGEIQALAGGYPPITLRCPIETCAGWAKGSAAGPWYCDECSYEWNDREEMDASIEEIIAARPYRAKCYVQKDGRYAPAPSSKEPKNYAELIEAELED